MLVLELFSELRQDVIFQGNPFSKLCTIQKLTNNSLIFSKLDSFAKKRARDWRPLHPSFFLMPSLFLLSHALFLLQESNWQKISELFVFVLYVVLKKKISLKVPILSFVWLKSILFNLLCVLGSFFTTLAVNSVFLVNCSLDRGLPPCVML